MPSEFTITTRVAANRVRAGCSKKKGVCRRRGQISEYRARFGDFDMFAKLGIESVRGMIRTKDDLYKELGLDNAAYFRQSSNTLPCSSVPFW